VSESGTRKWNKIGYLLTSLFRLNAIVVARCLISIQFLITAGRNEGERENQIKVVDENQNMWAMAA
jgi:hypothetical protein